MPHSARISIVVNNHNYATFLPAAIDSALAQTRAAGEVIVVDDGSTDASRDVIASYGDRVRPLFKENGGQASALNAGFAACRGDAVLFLDADDALRPTALEAVAGVWRDGVAKVQFPLEVVDRDGRPLGYRAPKAPMPSGDVSATVLAVGVYPSPPTSGNVFSRRALERLMPMAETHLSPDGHLIQASALLGDVVTIPEPLGAFRVHGGNNWALERELRPARLRQIAVSEEQKAAALRELGARIGVSVPADLALRVPDHLQARLASLRVEPGTHPYAGDGGWALAAKGIRACWRTPSYPLRKKLLFSGWFVALAASRGRLSRALASACYVPARRPRLLRAVVG
ncbi:MAG TPA: glycosyltransferase [Longimicrobiales bacterium]|nr:glycosyltransferase [Longimicrobiales bacterium]